MVTENEGVLQGKVYLH